MYLNTAQNSDVLPPHVGNKLLLTVGLVGGGFLAVVRHVSGANGVRSIKRLILVSRVQHTFLTDDGANDVNCGAGLFSDNWQVCTTAVDGILRTVRSSYL